MTAGEFEDLKARVAREQEEKGDDFFLPLPTTLAMIANLRLARRQFGAGSYRASLCLQVVVGLIGLLLFSGLKAHVDLALLGSEE